MYSSNLCFLCRNTLTADQKNLLSAVKEEGLQRGLNPLHGYMKWFMYHDICDLYSAQLPDMMHTLYKGLVIKNIATAASVIFHFNGRSMSCLAELDERLRNSYYQQSVNPFSKKTKFREGKKLIFYVMYLYNTLMYFVGLSAYFPNLKNFQNSEMKNGGLEAQRAPDLLFWLVFAIGTEGKIIPNYIVNHDFEGRSYRFNPTEVVLSSLVSNLELLWYSRSSEMTTSDIEIHFQRICNVADALYTKMRTMVAVFTGVKRGDASVKRHLWKHAPWFFLEYGSPKTNDCDLPEHDHIRDKQLYNQSSKRYDSNLAELLNLVTAPLCPVMFAYITLMYSYRFSFKSKL